MSLPSSTETKAAAARQHKSQPDIYTILLAISLVAIIIAIIFLYLETMDYKGQNYQGGPMVYQNAPAAFPTALGHPYPVTSQLGKHGCFNDFSATSDRI